MLSRTLQALALIVLMALPGTAKASWSGYWSWVTTPPPPAWEWTWIWYAPTSGWTVSSLAAADVQSIASDPFTATQDCCFIRIEGVQALKPESITYSGLLATDFTIIPNQKGGDLFLRYIGLSLFDPGAYLGTITLNGPSIGPGSSDAVTLAYSQSFDTTAGRTFEAGSIRSAVPEPSVWSLMIIGCGLAGAALRRRRAALRAA